MDFQNLLNVALDTSNKIDVLWGMFITVHAAMFGFLFLKESKLNYFRIFIIGLGYASFAFLNLKSLHSSYGLLQAVLDDIRQHFLTNPSSDPPNLQKYLENVKVQRMYAYSTAIHIISAVLVAFAMCRNMSVKLLVHDNKSSNG